MKLLLLLAAGGALAYVAARRKREVVPDDVLVVRVRQKLDAVVSQPGSIDVQARQGTVQLHGPVAQGELRKMVRAVRAVPGVGRVLAQLTPHA